MKNSSKQILLYASILFNGALLAGCGGGGSGSSGTSEGVQQNSPPEITGEARPYVQASQSYSFEPTATDSNGDMLQFSVQNLPAWASLDPNTGEITGQPDSTDVGLYEEIKISVTDGMDITMLPAFSIEVLQPPLARQNIEFGENTTVTETDSGYLTQGNVAISSDSNQTELEDSDLNFEFDSEDNLINITGTALLPAAISDYLSIDNQFRVIVGYYTGAEINQNEHIGIHSTPGIQLLDDIRYLVFFVGEELGVSIHQGSEARPPITLGIGEAQNLIIHDPNDPFTYIFGYLNGMGFGIGQSETGMIPYQPYFDDTDDAFEPLDNFYGHTVEKATFPLGIRVFDILQITGTRVVHNPQFEEIDWDDPLNSTIQYQTGFNGNAELTFAVLGIGLFSYQLADMSATLDVGTERQHFALQGVYQVEESSQPIWLPVRPSPEPNHKAVSNVFVDGNGDFSLEILGELRSDLPEATLSGSMLLSRESLLLNGRIEHDTNPLTISATANNEIFTATVDTHIDVNAGLRDQVMADMDHKIAEVQAAVSELEDATAGYEYAVSLDGIRSQLPAIADNAIAVLNSIPGTVYTQVYNSARNYINNGEHCIGVSPFRTCYQYSDYVSATSVARTAGNSARRDAVNAIAPYISDLQEMKRRANEVDDESLRIALKTILLRVYNNRRFNRTFSYAFSRTIDYGVGSFTISRTFSHNVNQNVMTPVEAALVNSAADKVDNISSTQQIMISAQQVVEAAPTEQAITQAKQEVNDGLEQIPTFDGAGYSVTGDGVLTSYIILDGERKEITFNLLDPDAVYDDIINFISLSIINQ